MPLRQLALLLVAFVVTACGKRDDPRAPVTYHKGGGAEPDKPKAPPDGRIAGQSYEAWYKVATGDDARARLKALGQVKGLADHPRAGDLAAVVLYRFDDKDEAVRKEAAVILPTLGKAASDRIGGIWSSLPPPSADRVKELFALLRQMGKHEVPALIEAVRHDLWRISRLAADRLVELKGDAIEPLAAALVNEKGWFKDKLNMPAAALSEIGAPAVPALLIAARDPKRREGAILALRKMGKPGADALTTLSQDKDTAVKARAVLALASLRPVSREKGKEPKPPQPPAAEALAALGADGSKPVAERAEALARLARMGPTIDKALPVLRKLVVNEKEDDDLRGLAAFAIGTMGANSKDAVGDLVKLLESRGKQGERWLRFCAIVALGGIGPEARAATPALVKELSRGVGRGTDPVLAGVAIQALARIGPGAKEAVEPLRKFAEADKGNYQLRAKPDAIVALVAIENSPATRERARKFLPGAAVKFCLALWNVSTELRPAVVERLGQILDDTSGRMDGGADALDALAVCGPEASAAISQVLARYRYSSTFLMPNHDNPLGTGLIPHSHGPRQAASRTLANELYPRREGDMNRSLLRCLGSIGKGSPLAEAFLEHLGWFAFDGTHRALARQALERIAPARAAALPRG